MHSRMNKHVVVAAASLAALAGSAWAQSGAGGFDKPLTGRGTRALRAAEVQPQTRITMRQSDGGKQFELRINDGQMSASIDGEEVDSDQIRRRGDSVELLDEDGKVLTTFSVGNMGVNRAPRAGGGFARPMAPSAPQAAQPMQPPKVMLGVNLSEPGGSLREQLNLDEGEGILLARVFEGMPAHEAGLRDNDVIIGVEGESPITAGRLREILLEKEPGDTLEVTVVRQGAAKKFEVELEPWDSDRLASMAPQTWVAPEGEKLPEEYQRMLDERMRAFGRGGEMPPMVWGPGDQNNMRFFIPGGVDPQRMEELEKRLKDTNKRLEELTKKIDALQRQLERGRN